MLVDTAFIHPLKADARPRFAAHRYRAVTTVTAEHQISVLPMKKRPHRPFCMLLKFVEIPNWRRGSDSPTQAQAADWPAGQSLRIPPASMLTLSTNVLLIDEGGTPLRSAKPEEEKT